MIIVLNSCQEPTPSYANFEDYPTAEGASLWTEYTPRKTTFKLWSPTADRIRLNLYEKGDGGEAIETHYFVLGDNGVWTKTLEGDKKGVYYTYQLMIDDEWLDETPGIYAQAVGVNGERAMVIDLYETNPLGWEQDNGPKVVTPNEAIIYEAHVRDLSIHPDSGIEHKGKFLGLTERGTKCSNGLSTGLDHIKEMGVTHIHLLPAFDHYSINERKLDSAQYNWGYDPQNYNVPEGSFSTNPYSAEVRIKEFKQMVKSFHDEGIGVILDVVYNHTGITENSNFNLESPGYYYRFWEDGSYSDAAACDNETASERAMMRKFMIESVLYWAKEYHLDGFRFDLMGIHDVETMNQIADALKAFNPNILIYGEGWTAGDSPLSIEDRGLKLNIPKMPHIVAFSDDLRDGLKGSVFEEMDTGFISGKSGMEESIKFGVVGCIQHPQINYSEVNYSNTPWTLEPWQSIAYVSCHDNHTLYDKLMISRRDATEEERIAMNKLAMAIVMTSQGVSFLHAGGEMLRTKGGEHNSYKSPDSINQIDYSRKLTYKEVTDYYKNLIALKKAHPAFRIPTAEGVRQQLTFEDIGEGVVVYHLNDYANGDVWKNIKVIYNARTTTVPYSLKGSWKKAVWKNTFYEKPSDMIDGTIFFPEKALSILIQE